MQEIRKLMEEMGALFIEFLHDLACHYPEGQFRDLFIRGAMMVLSPNGDMLQLAFDRLKHGVARVNLNQLANPCYCAWESSFKFRYR